MLSGADAPVDLGGGLTLLVAEARHVDGILAVETDAFGAADGPGIRAAIAATGSTEDWLVVVDGDDQVISASALLDHELVVDGCSLPTGQIEWVASRPAYQRRGLVRAQFARHHQRSAERGHLVQLIAGIPYLYRRFGYGYGIEYPTVHVLRGELRDALEPGGLTVRSAVEADLPALGALEATRPETLLRMRRGERTWRRAWLSNTFDDGRYERLVLAVDGERVVGVAQVKVDGDEARRVHVGIVLAEDTSAVDALLADALAHGADDPAFHIAAFAGEGSRASARLHELVAPLPPLPGYYVRIPEPVALLDALRPALSGRLRGSAYASKAGTVTISFYNDAASLTYEAGEVTEVDRVAGIEDPLEQLGVGVAPDWFPALVLGRWGARELETRVDDVTLGRYRALLDVLFPARDADLSFDL